MRRRSSESVWQSVVPGDSMGGRHGRHDMFSVSTPRQAGSMSPPVKNMGPVQQVCRCDGSVSVVSAVHGAGATPNFVQVENHGGMTRVPRQQAVLRGESAPHISDARRQQQESEAASKAARMVVE